MIAARSAHDPFEGYDPFRLHVFVPAIMSAGLLFSLVTLLRDALARRGHRRTAHRVQLAAQSTAAIVLGPLGPPASEPRGDLRPRGFYTVVAAAAVLGASYLVPGAVLNYLRPGGYVSDIAWLLCLSLLVGGLLVATGFAAALVVVDWPTPRRQVRWMLQVAPAPPVRLAGPDAEATSPAARSVPSPWLGAGVLASVAALTFTAVGVAVGRFRWFDVDVAGSALALDLPWVAHAVAALGSTPVSLLLATAIGAVAVRCRTFALSWVTAVVATFAVDAALKAGVGRSRPPGTALSGLADSFPSGHVAQLVLIAVAAPLALRVFTSPAWVRRAIAIALAAGVAVAGVERVHTAFHWPTDVAGGAFLGAGMGLAMWWVVAHGDWHRRCSGCPWRADRGGGDR
jgi:membrane-associated phospholipid phosphatase